MEIYISVRFVEYAINLFSGFITIVKPTLVIVQMPDLMRSFTYIYNAKLFKPHYLLLPCLII